MIETVDMAALGGSFNSEWLLSATAMRIVTPAAVGTTQLGHRVIAISFAECSRYRLHMRS